MEKNKGVIYILTNPSFPQYVKIGYADDVEQRLAQLNRSECIPFAFRLYAYYEVSNRLTDIKLHRMIDNLNPNLRAIDDFKGKQRIREFYAMDAQDAYNILETIAEMNGLSEKLVLVEPSQHEQEEEKQASEIIKLSWNRHHFKDIEFSSSLTGKRYLGTTSDDGTLCIIDFDIKKEVPNNSKPSKKAIVRKAIEDLGQETKKNDTLYQLYHKLTKIIINN